ncbi:Stk1 family PASTA domain-containing Ser/Thr kinase [Marinicrinis sediminis]|uniref:non-specific serine/threonine protein kinase n=1 Tax=Marinicrinis sediminis TaxID=1652465 RepID=A0ABW5R613_9BACL
MIGQTLSGRYEILDRVGGGGMAIVYKAHDVLLHRNVAVKVLRSQFVHDEDFIHRFRREARAAASLSHPNVVSIYDVGQQEDIHYIIMEFVEGATLNERIKEHAPLQVEEAVHIATQICDALEHAHQNEIIHRDIKPHNILIGRNGRVKVTDFGIARAAASSDLTQTGSVLGSVHYFSPEQAKGVAQGEKSDLYSLGIVLYQMLTNQLPFLGESPISVALKHLQEPFEDPRSLNPMIPQSVENIMLKALRKTPEERYTSAREMLDDLTSCLQGDRRNEPKLLFHDVPDEEQTIVMPAIRNWSPDSENEGETVIATPDSPPRRGKSAVAAETAAVGKQAGDAQSAATKKKAAWVKPVLISFLTLILLVLMWFGVKAVRNMFTVPEVEVPTVIGMTLEEAKLELEKNGLQADPIEQQYSDQYAEGIVMDQTERNITVREDSPIGLTVSQGEKLEAMEPYIGKKWEDVSEEIEALVSSDRQITLEQAYSDATPGTIIDQTPRAGERFKPENVQMKFVLSQGPETFPMPDLVGKKVSEAESIIYKNDLELDEDAIQYEPDFQVPKDIVIRQFPYEAGERVAPGSRIDKLIVSSGLPDDALEPKQRVEIDPVEDGELTTVRIVISDARGNDNEVVNEDITKTDAFNVQPVVTEAKNATITVYRDDVFYESWTITYKDAKKQGNKTRTLKKEQPEPQEEPSAQQEPPVNEQPSEDEEDEEGEEESSGNSLSNLLDALN